MTCQTCRWFKRKTQNGGLCWFHQVQVLERDTCNQWLLKVIR